MHFQRPEENSPALESGTDSRPSFVSNNGQIKKTAGVENAGHS